MNRGIDDVAFLSNPDRWPNWPVCPVKNYQRKDAAGFPACGIVIAGDSAVYEVNMFALSGMTYNDLQEECKVKHSYTDLAEMVADGWIVD